MSSGYRFVTPNSMLERLSGGKIALKGTYGKLVENEVGHG